MRFCAVALFLLLAAAAAFASGGIDNLTDAVFWLCNSLKGLMPVLSMLMVLAGSTIYAAGQIFGAETRARANVWATAALTGALIGLLITIIAPPVLSAISGEDVNCDIFVP